MSGPTNHIVAPAKLSPETSAKLDDLARWAIADLAPRLAKLRAMQGRLR